MGTSNSRSIRCAEWLSLQKLVVVGVFGVNPTYETRDRCHPAIVEFRHLPQLIEFTES